jgi:hypothetical protein
VARLRQLALRNLGRVSRLLVAVAVAVKVKVYPTPEVEAVAAAQESRGLN